MENNETKKSAAAEREERILALWQEGNFFQKSLEKEAPKGNYVFYDGPPFATGLPHYGHILGSTAKDTIARYQTMQGYRVPRRWGWDCHGLPIENIVEKDLKISGHKEIEAYGLEQFTEYARSKVLTYVQDWKKTVDRIGRWVDFDGGYKTMDNTFIESVWWALAELNKKGLIYEGVRVLAYCPRCETPIANSEIAMDNSYKDITDISVYAKFALADEEKTYLVAWTTTPWTLPGNVALAVNPEFEYAKIEIDAGTYIIAKDRLSVVRAAYKEIGSIKGSELIGKKYVPPFDYFRHDANLTANPKIWTVVAGDFVTLDAGTGIVHIAPAFGEDDMQLAKKEGLPWIIHVTPMGQFADKVTHFAGQYVKPKDNHQAIDIEIVKYLAHNHLLFEKEKIVHSYPHCYRCDTPLYYYALPSWFVNVQKSKDATREAAKEMNWIPSHLKDGRFKATLDTAPDWTISRNRYWASPIPVWKSASGKMLFIGSIDDLKAKTKTSGNTYTVMRHGESEKNLTRTISVVADAPDHLTENGRRQVRASAEALKSKRFDVIVASPFVRTRETAEIAAEICGISKESIIFDDRLREMNPGEFGGTTWKEYHMMIPKTAENFSVALPGGESYQDVKRRMGEALYDLDTRYQGKNILVITHGGPFWMLSAVAKGYDATQAINMLAMDDELQFIKNAEYRAIDFVPLPHNAQYVLDLHRPYIDRITLVDEAGETYTRIPEVIDCWFESGSMPFAQDHYPFERPKWQEENFPAGFVAEYIAQTRTWFYYTHTLSTMLFGRAPFKNVVTTGTVLAADGQKMSKSKGNYPDPWLLFNRFGVDPLRLYLMSSPVMKGEDLNFLEKGVQDIASKIIGRLDNVVTFYELYRDINVETASPVPTHVLDQWILARLAELVSTVTSGMEAYDMVEATRPFDLFVDDLSTWYVRRTRERIKDGDISAKQTLYTVLKTLAVTLAPFAPFIAEDIWQKLKVTGDAESVHLADWPEIKEINKEILATMEIIRSYVSIGLMERQKKGIKVRQPLQKFSVKHSLNPLPYWDEVKTILADELNVKEVVLFTAGQDESPFILDTNITFELKAEGDFRELVRGVQDLRKKMNLLPSDEITLTIETDEEGRGLVEKFEQEFKKTVLATAISFAGNNGMEIKIDALTFKVTIVK